MPTSLRTKPQTRRRTRPRPYWLLLPALLLILWLLPRGGSSAFAGVGRTPGTLGPSTVIALDAGHGGSDVGAGGFCTEADVNQAVIEALNTLLEKDPRFTVVLTHAAGEYAGIPDRAKTANDAGAALFLSAHCNSDNTNADSNGFECYAEPPFTPNHEASVRLAQSIVAAVQGTLDLRIRGTSGVRYMYYHGDDRQVAEYGDNKEYSHVTFGVLNQTDCPAVLIEQFFVTNRADAANYGTADGCAALARCYYEGICGYLDLTPMSS